MKLALLLVALVLAACGEPAEECDMSHPSGLPPWHMWGNTKTLDVTQNASALASATEQLVRIAYARPETWKFFFAAKIITAKSPGAAVCAVNFDLTLGVGRSQVNLPAFAAFTFPPTVAPGQFIYCNTVVGPSRTGAGGVTNYIDSIPAQDIQLKGTVLLSGGTNGVSEVKVELNAFFSPASHIRPEWYEGRFPGGEDGGH